MHATTPGLIPGFDDHRCGQRHWIRQGNKWFTLIGPNPVPDQLASLLCFHRTGDTGEIFIFDARLLHHVCSSIARTIVRLVRDNMETRGHAWQLQYEPRSGAPFAAQAKASLQEDAFPSFGGGSRMRYHGSQSRPARVGRRSAPTRTSLS